MGNGALERTMFWTGAMIALMPVALGLIVLWVVLRNRRKTRNGSGEQT
jgi:hypothetical protein